MITWISHPWEGPLGGQILEHPNSTPYLRYNIGADTDLKLGESDG